MKAELNKQNFIISQIGEKYRNQVKIKNRLTLEV